MTEEKPGIPPKIKQRVKLQPYSAGPFKAPASTISSFKKKQQAGPFIIGSIAVFLLVAGIILIFVWITSGNGPKLAFMMSPTPTVTITPTPTNTSTPEPTVTETATPTETVVPTASVPFDYTIQEGDSLYDIALKFLPNDDFGLVKIFTLNPEIDQSTGSVSIGQIIKIPDPNYQLPTATAIPSNLPFGTKIQYVIQPLDTIASIAEKFNSTFDDIVKENKLTDPNKIYSGQVITIRVNLVVRRPTITPGASPTPPSPFTPTPNG